VVEVNAMVMTNDQKARFARDGFLHLPGIIPEDVRRRATRAINASIGRGMNVADLPTLSAQGFCPELKGTPVLTDLVNATPVLPLAESAIGPGRVRPASGGQVALRFPVDSDDPPRPPGAHIDGMYTPTNGVKPGTISNFTALVGVFLSDVPDDFWGNFTVWPGSHLTHADYFRANGPQSLLNGMPKVGLGAGVQVKARAGDAVLAHYLLGHGVAANVSPHVRYACFFRLKSVDHERLNWETMTDAWLDWHGMRDA
jgi:hypothetical protein